MAEVDREAVIDSMKVLGIVFIITISTFSLSLLVKLVRIQDNAFRLRRVMVGILTCGTLLFSLFPLVVDVRIQFEPFDVTCRTSVLASVYQNFYFPFVYAVGLILLALELYATKRGYPSPPPLPLRVFYVVFPWLLGCVLVLPLTLSGVHFDTCTVEYSLAKIRATVWVCNLLPAIAVLLIAIFLAFKVGGDSTAGCAGNPAVASSSSTQRVVHSSSSSSSYGGGFQPVAGYISNPPPGVLMGMAPPPSQPRPDSNHFHQPPYDYSSPPPSYQASTYQPHQPYHHKQPYPALDVTQPQQHHPQQQPPPHYPPPPPPPLNYAPPPPGFGTPYYEYDPGTAHNNHHHHHHHHHHLPQNTPQSQPQVSNGARVTTAVPGTAPASNTAPIFRDLRNEAKTFAKVAALFVFCSLPLAIFNLAYGLNPDRTIMDELSNTVISHLVAWLAVLRWLLLIICWFLSIK